MDNMACLGYIDPGSGLLVWQMVVAAFVGLVFYLKRTRDWIFGLFRRLFRAEERADERVAQPPPVGQQDGP